MTDLFDDLVISYHSIEVYEILVIQDEEGKLLSIKIDEYEPEQTQDPEYSGDAEIIH
jgi:hypothetical protein